VLGQRDRREEGEDGGTGADGVAGPANVVISAAARTLRTTTWSVNYWQWAPTYGNNVAGTESLVAAVTPSFIRVGGYNNDANTPDAFNDVQMDALVVYAAAIGAQPIIQVPLLQDTNGQPPTADTAAAMVRYANATKGYRIKYFSLGNEPDLYATQGLPSDASKPAIPNYGPSDYCATAHAYVTAMKAVDPTILIVGRIWRGSTRPAMAPTTADPDSAGLWRSFRRGVDSPLSLRGRASLAVRSGGRCCQVPLDHHVGAGILQATGYGQRPLPLPR